MSRLGWGRLSKSSVGRQTSLGMTRHWPCIGRNELLSGFDGKRAIDLVKAGKADAVLAFLDMVEHGVPA